MSTGASWRQTTAVVKRCRFSWIRSSVDEFSTGQPGTVYVLDLQYSAGARTFQRKVFSSSVYEPGERYSLEYDANDPERISDPERVFSWFEPSKWIVTALA